jgi:predicted dehydrogenase
MEVNPATAPWRDRSVLLLGCGSIGRRHARVLRSLGVIDLRLYDTDRDKAVSLAAETPGSRVEGSLEEALGRKPDAVYVLTPPGSHVPLAIRALQGGSHVFCEKPLSTSTQDLPALSDAIATSGKRFMVGLCFRFHPGLRRMHRLVVDEAAVGRALSVRAFVGEHLPTVRPDYRTLFSATSVGVFDLVHDLDLVMWLAGGPPHTVHALHGSISDIGISAPDLAEVIMAFPAGTIGSVHLDYFVRPRRRYLEAIGTGGTIRIDFEDWNAYTVTATPASGTATRETCATERDEMFRDQSSHFLDAIARGAPIATGLAEGSWTVALLERLQLGDGEAPRSSARHSRHAAAEDDA